MRRLFTLAITLAAVILAMTNMVRAESDQVTFVYDALHRLVEARYARGTVVTYTYDATGNRLSRSVVVDLDADGVRAASDCDDLSATVWAIPAEVRDLVFLDRWTLSWSPPDPLGSPAGWERYNIVRSTSAADFGAGATCLLWDTYAFQAWDHDEPAQSGAFFYVINAENDCPGGQGSFGRRTNGQERAVRACP